MKNLIYVLKNKKIDTLNSHDYIYKSTDIELIEKLNDELIKIERDALNKFNPIWLRVSKTISFYGMLVLLIGILRGINEVTLKVAFKNAPYIFIIFLVLIVLYIIFFTISKIFEQKFNKSNEIDNIYELIENKKQEYYQLSNFDEVGVKIDLLTELFYKNKKQELKKYPIGKNIFICVETNIYKNNNFLYIQNFELTLKIPFKDIKKVEPIEDKLYLANWNKDIIPNEDPYNLKIINELIEVKKQYKVLIQIDEKQFYLIIPSYDIKKFIEIIEENV